MTTLPQPPPRKKTNWLLLILAIAPTIASAINDPPPPPTLDIVYWTYSQGYIDLGTSSENPPLSSLYSYMTNNIGGNSNPVISEVSGLATFSLLTTSWGNLAYPNLAAALGTFSVDGSSNSLPGFRVAALEFAIDTSNEYFRNYFRESRSRMKLTATKIYPVDRTYLFFQVVETNGVATRVTPGKVTIPANQKLSGSPLVAGNPVTEFKIEQADRRQGMRVTIDLVPVEIQVKRGGIADEDGKVASSSPTWRSQNGVIRDEISLWHIDTRGDRVFDQRADWLQVRVNLPNWIKNLLPTDTIKWDIPGQPTPSNNTLQTEVLRWPSYEGSKIAVKVEVAGEEFYIHADFPAVGSVSEAEWGILMSLRPGGLLGAINCKINSERSIAWSNSLPFMESHRNALRHSFWISACASDPLCGPDFALLLGNAHEHSNTFAWPYEATMDLFNNYVGSTIVRPFDLTYYNAKQELLRKLADGSLRIWDSYGVEHTGFRAIKKSNGDAIYNN